MRRIIKSGYRPIFKFDNDFMLSGNIQLQDRNELLPDTWARVKVYFLTDNGDKILFRDDKRYFFYESPLDEPIGEFKPIITKK